MRYAVKENKSIDHNIRLTSKILCCLHSMVLVRPSEICTRKRILVCKLWSRFLANATPRSKEMFFINGWSDVWLMWENLISHKLDLFPNSNFSVTDLTQCGTKQFVHKNCVVTPYSLTLFLLIIFINFYNKKHQNG